MGRRYGGDLPGGSELGWQDAEVEPRYQMATLAAAKLPEC